MKIEQLQLQPHDTKIGGMDLSIKTFKKKWQVKTVWWQQVIAMDETGEMPVDVKINKFKPLNGHPLIHVTVAKVRDAEYLNKPRKILVVDQYTVPTQTVDEMYAEADEAYQGEIQIVRSKIKCLLACHNGPKADPAKLWEYINDDNIDKIVDKIMER